MVDITKIVEKGMKEEKENPKPKGSSKQKSNLQESKVHQKTVLDDIFGDRNDNEEPKNENVGFSKKLGNLFGVEEEDKDV